MYTVHRGVYTVHCTSNNIHCTPYVVHYAADSFAHKHSVHSIVYVVHTRTITHTVASFGLDVISANDVSATIVQYTHTHPHTHRHTHTYTHTYIVRTQISIRACVYKYILVCVLLYVIDILSCIYIC